MNTLKIAAAVLFTAASTAFASTAFASSDDGNLDNAWLTQTPATQTQLVRQAPAPVASGADAAKQEVRGARQSAGLDNAVIP
jgi:hypothetical protein